MTELTKVEYKVRKVERFMVTRYEEGRNEDIEVGPKHWAGSTTHGEFDSAVTAYEVACALAGAEHQRHGWPLDDGRMQYPSDDLLHATPVSAA